MQARACLGSEGRDGPSWVGRVLCSVGQLLAASINVTASGRLITVAEVQPNTSASHCNRGATARTVQVSD